MITPEELNEIRIFACLEEQDRRRFAQKAAEVYLREGDVLIREGETPYFYVMMEGRLLLSKEVLGKTQDFAEYQKGDFFGEVPILLGIPSLASLRAKTFSRIARFERQQLHELIKTSEVC